VLLVQAILGRHDDPRYEGRRIERLSVTSTAAAKRRFRARTDAGSDVALDLPRGSYIEHGAVLFDDGGRIIVAEREPEEALVIRLSPTLGQAELVRQAALIGHAFGNQHVPLEVADGEVHVPITTSPEIAAATVERLALPGAELSFARVQFARHRPPAAAHGHGAHPDVHDE
jgi:urease accessory protein